MQWTSLCLLSEFLWHVYIFRYMYNSFIDHYIYQVLLCLLSDKVSLHGMFVFLNIYVQSFYRSFNRLSPIIFTDWLGEFAWYVCIFRYMYNRVCGLLFPSLTCCFMYSGEQSGFFYYFMNMCRTILTSLQIFWTMSLTSLCVVYFYTFQMNSYFS